MKCKVFEMYDNDFIYIETEINKWLFDNKSIEIVNVFSNNYEDKGYNMITKYNELTDNSYNEFVLNDVVSKCKVMIFYRERIEVNLEEWKKI